MIYTPILLRCFPLFVHRCFLISQLVHSYHLRGSVRSWKSMVSLQWQQAWPGRFTCSKVFPPEGEGSQILFKLIYAFNISLDVLCFLLYMVCYILNSVEMFAWREIIYTNAIYFSFSQSMALINCSRMFLEFVVL